MAKSLTDAGLLGRPLRSVSSPIEPLAPSLYELVCRGEAYWPVTMQVAIPQETVKIISE